MSVNLKTNRYGTSLVRRGLTLYQNILYSVCGIRKHELLKPVTANDTMTMIQFRMNTRKALEAVVWLLSEHPGLTRHTIAKVLYYADKRHLHQYGRPVIGDRYVAMNEGMVPSRVLDILEKDGRYLRPEEIEAREGALRGYEGEQGHPAYEALREPDTDYLSRTDIEALRWSLEEYGF